jgi:hypothetical protein
MRAIMNEYYKDGVWLLTDSSQIPRRKQVLFFGQGNNNRVDLVPSICHNNLDYLKEYIDKRGRENND